MKNNPFYQKFKGRFSGVLRWEQLDQLWDSLAQTQVQWYLYDLSQAPPLQAQGQVSVKAFINEIDKILRSEHQEDYCGIVYVDSLSDPSMIKVFHPKRLGVVCGSSDNPPLPAWIISLLPPIDLPELIYPSPKQQKSVWRRWLPL